MKIGCHCGASIIDQTDDLPHQGHMIPDQEWFATYDAIDDAVVDPVADGQLGHEAAYHRARQLIGRSARLMWQCQECGRLYIDGLHRGYQCFRPEVDCPPTRRSSARQASRVRSGAWAHRPGVAAAGHNWRRVGIRSRDERVLRWAIRGRTGRRGMDPRRVHGRCRCLLVAVLRRRGRYAIGQ